MPRPDGGGYDVAPGDAMREPMGATDLADSAKAILADRRWRDGGSFFDSLFAAGITAGGISDADAVALSSLLRSLGEEDRAARLLLDRPSALLSADGSDELRAAARGMSLEELESLRRVIATVRIPESAAGIVSVEYARALALTGEVVEAERIARDLRREALLGPERDTAADLQAGRIQPLVRPVRIGAVLSLTGRFSRVGEDLQDGIRLAVDEWNAIAGPCSTTWRRNSKLSASTAGASLRLLRAAAASSSERTP